MSNIAVKITADQTALTAQFALASASSRAFSAELNNLAKQAVTAGGASPALAAQMQQVAAQMLAAKGRVSELKDELNQGTGGFQKYTQGVSLLKEGLSALGVSFSAAAVVAFGKSVFDATEQVYQQAQVLGMTTTVYQDFAKSAQLAGVSVDTVNTALMRFNAAQGAALSGIGNQAKAFNDLGVSAKLSAADALPAVARALLSIQDVARRSRDEVDLFGRSGQELNPALEQWAQGTDDLTQKLQALGLMLDDKTTKAANDAKEAMDLAWGQVDVAWAPQIIKMTELLATLAGWLAKLQDLGKSFNDSIPAWMTRPLFGGSTPGGATASDSGLASIAPGESGRGHRSGTPSPNYTDTADAKKAAELARQATDARLQVEQQAGLRRIEVEEQTNDVLLQVGKQSQDTWLQQAFDLENQRYQIALTGIHERETADAGNQVALARDQAQEQQLYQESSDRKDAIYAGYLERKQALDQADLQTFIQNQQAQLQSDIQGVEAQYESHRITADQRHDLEIQETNSVEAEVLKRLDAEIAGLTQGTTAYAAALQQRDKLTAQFNKQIETTNDALVKEQNAQWATFGNSLKSSFNSTLDSIITQGGTLKSILGSIATDIAEAFLQMGEQIAENWIMTSLLGESTGAASALAKVGQNAAVAASAAWASTAAIPIVGPELAPGAAAASYAGAMAYGSLVALDTGADYVPRDGMALIHRGERVIPAADNSALMSAVGGANGSGGGDVHLTINMSTVDSSAGIKFIKAHARDIAKTVQAHVRYNPSARAQVA